MAIKYKIIFLIALFVSCYREEKISLLECTNCRIPVVLCFITPLDTISVDVFETAAFNSVQNRIYAEVTITDSSSGRNIVLSPDKNIQSRYVAAPDQFDIIPGHTYSMVVKINDGRVLSSKTTVPDSAVRWLNCEIIGYKEEEGMKSSIVKCTWPKSMKYGYLIGTKLPLIYFEGDTSSYRLIFNRIKITEINQQTLEYIDDGPSTDYELLLLTLNKPFSEYIKAYDFYSTISDNTGTRFALQMYNGIIPEYTNIIGGIGVFGAYLTDKRKIYFKP